MRLKFWQLKIYMQQQISFKAKNQINKHINNHELSDSTKKQNLGVSLYKQRS